MIWWRISRLNEYKIVKWITDLGGPYFTWHVCLEGSFESSACWLCNAIPTSAAPKLHDHPMGVHVGVAWHMGCRVALTPWKWKVGRIHMGALRQKISVIITTPLKQGSRTYTGTVSVPQNVLPSDVLSVLCPILLLRSSWSAAKFCCMF